MKPPGRIPLLLIACLLVLQCGDFLCTWRLLSGEHGVYEANPLAAALLERFGWAALVLLKCGTSGLVVLAVVLLGRHRPALARRVLGGLCLVLASVVLYSGWLLLRPGHPLTQELPGLAEEDAKLDRYLDGVVRFARKRQAICDDVLHGRVNLSVGVHEMGACLVEEKPHLASSIHAYLPATDRPDEVAAFVYYHASRLVAEGRARASQLANLDQQMSRDYPAAPRLDQRREGPYERFPWGEGRRMMVHLTEAPGPS